MVAPSSQTPSFVQPIPVERPTTEGATPQVFIQPSLPAQHDQIVEEKPSAPTILFTTTNVRLRASPSTSAAIVRTVPPRTPIESVGQEAGWHKVNVGRDQGWIRQDLLSPTRPALQESREPPSAPAAPLARQAPDRQSGQPLRDPYVGTATARMISLEMAGYVVGVPLTADPVDAARHAIFERRALPRPAGF
ncbi:MAG: SH3 domain-containing protein [Rhizobium sp.]|nr:SH3 domain-containing protein [Rhizobium sp.]